MVFIGIYVAEQDGRGVEGVDHDVDLSVVEEVSEGGATTGRHHGEAGVLYGRDELELFAFHVAIEKRALGEGGAPVVFIDSRVDVAVDHHEVFPTVVVVVDELGGPSEEGDGVLRDAGMIADVGEVGVSVVVIEDFVVVGKGRNQEVVEAVVLVVAYGEAHGGYFAAVLVEGEAGGVAVVVEGSVALVDVEVVGRGVVGYGEVYFAVVVQIDEDAGESVVLVRVVDSGFDADVGEGSVAVVVKEVIRLAFEAAGTAHDADSAKVALGEGDGLGSGDGQVA